MTHINPQKHTIVKKPRPIIQMYGTGCAYVFRSIEEKPASLPSAFDVESLGLDLGTAYMISAVHQHYWDNNPDIC